MRRNGLGGIDLTTAEVEYLATTAILDAVEFGREPSWEDFPYVAEYSWEAVDEAVKRQTLALAHERGKWARASGIDARALLDAVRDH